MKPSSSSSDYPDSCRYDVYLSFHGGDTRNNFTSHLRAALIRHGIQIYQLVREEATGAHILKAIEESRISIIILSENYASSRWRLEELVHILERKRSNTHWIFPVFYKVEPSDVRKQKGKWGEAFDQHEFCLKDVAKVEKWRRAAGKVANLAGWHVSSDCNEADLVDRIVKQVAIVLKPKHLHVADCPVGIESRVHDMDKLLCVGGDDVRMVGIWGLGGIGKTTVAKAVFNSINQRFQGSCFLENIREKAKGDGLVSLQNLLLSEILGSTTIGLTNVDEGISVIKGRLSHGRFLLVLDDVDGLELLRSLAGGLHWFGLGSRVIITTSNKHLLIAHQVSRIYNVRKLDHHESLVLFSYYSFPKTGVPKELHAAVPEVPKEHHTALTGVLKEHHAAVSGVQKEHHTALTRVLREHRAAVPGVQKEHHTALTRVLREHHAAVPGVPKEHHTGLTGVLREHHAAVLGVPKQHQASATGIPGEYWNLVIDAVEYAQGLPLALVVLGSVLHGRSIEEWKEARDGNWKVGTRVLYETLRISYDALDLVEKEVFLDIACFFNGENNNQLRQLLEGMFPDICLKNLQEKALISINAENHIWMHNWLEVMGKDIVYNESPNEPSERSRLWDSDDVYNVLTKGTGTNKVKGIMVKLAKPDKIVLSATSFLGMQNLKYFINCNASFSGYIGYLPDELRLIDWPEFHFESLPINFSLRKLVKLNMPRSRISRLGERFECSKNLVYMNLESCVFLRELPNFSAFPDLKCLNLCNCSSLIELDDSIGFLDKLVTLNLSGCSSLIKLPRRVALKSVKYISLRGCSQLRSFPKIVKKMKWLKSLDMSGTAIKKLPSPIAFLNSLEELTLRECDKLTNLPDSIYELQNLWSLDLQDCSNLEKFPKWSAELVKVPNNSPDLCYLNLYGCKKLQEIPELPPKVEWVKSANCSALERFVKLSNILERKESKMIKCVSLLNCRKLCESLSNQMEQNERILLNEVSLCSIFLSCKDSEFDVVYPGTEVPKWFKHRKVLEELADTSEFSIDIPQNFKSGDIGLAICAATSVYGFGHYSFPAPSVHDFGHCSFTARINIQEESTLTRSFMFEAKDMESAHVWLLYIPLFKFVDCQLPPIRVSLEHTSHGSVRCKSYGVHLVMPQVENEDQEDGNNSDDKYSASESDEA